MHPRQSTANATARITKAYWEMNGIATTFPMIATTARMSATHSVVFLGALVFMMFTSIYNDNE